MPAARATVTFGTSPQQLGAVIDNYNPNSPPTELYDPSLTGDAYNRPTLDINDYLLPASSNGTGGNNGNGNDNNTSDDGNNDDHETVNVAFFDANQPSLDGLYDGFSIRDTATDVSGGLDALNDDSNLTDITLTDGGTPTLTLDATQALNDTTALDDITNPSYAIAIVDTCANVSQNFDALNADSAVTSITLTDAATASLTLTAIQVLQDTVALGEITNSSYTITVIDAADSISAVIDALNGNANVTAVTFTDDGTPTLSLTAAQTLGDTKVLDEITNASYGITVEDTATNILANASALSADASVTSAEVVDSAANVLDNADALNTDAQVTAIAVVDSVANIFANLTTLQDDAKVTSLFVADTAANILANAAAITSVSEIDGIGVVDTAADVSANIDALNADAAVGSITLTDSGTPALTLTVAQALGDAGALGKITASYVVDVADTAAAVGANIDALGAVAGLAQITLTDAGTPTLTLTAAQAVDDAAVLALITNSNLQVVVSDTAADVAAAIDALNADPIVSAIVLTDAGTPILTLTAAQALGDTTALGKIENTNVQIAISDTAADVSANFDALNADAALSSIVLTDSGTPTLILTVAQAIDDTALLAKISNTSYAVAIFDSVANILANAAALEADPQVASITAVDTVADLFANSAALTAAGSTSQIVTDNAADVAANMDAIDADASIAAISLTDSGTPTLVLTAAQAIGDAAVLTKIVNSTFAVDIVDSAANVSAAIDTLTSNRLIAAVTLSDAGIPTLSLNVADFLGDAGFLAKITNTGYVVDIADSAAAVSASLDALNSATAVGAITLTDPGTPMLDLTAAQALGDTTALGLITNASYAIAVTDTVANVLADATALAADPQVSSIAIVDNAANVLAAADELATNPQVTSVTVVDTAADVLADAGALASLPIPTTIDVVDSAADVSANFDALNSDFSVRQITLTDANPVLTLTAAQAATDFSAIFKITNPSYAIAVVDTAANVSTYLTQLAFNASVTSITLTDPGTPVLDLSGFSLGFDSGALSKITNPDYTISLTGPVNVSVATFLAYQATLDATPGGFTISDLGSNIAAAIDALNADPNLTGISVFGGYGGTGGMVVLSAVQAVNDTRAVGLIISSGSSPSVEDSVANILANYAALAANGQITSVVAQDTAANVLANAAALNADRSSARSWWWTLPRTW